LKSETGTPVFSGEKCSNPLEIRNLSLRWLPQRLIRDFAQEVVADGIPVQVTGQKMRKNRHVLPYECGYCMILLI
jgi:hypothetical protein